MIVNKNIPHKQLIYCARPSHFSRFTCIMNAQTQLDIVKTQKEDQKKTKNHDILIFIQISKKGRTNSHIKIFLKIL